MLPSTLSSELVLPICVTASFGKDFIFSSAASKKGIDAINRRLSSDRSNRQYRSAASVSVTSAHRPCLSMGHVQYTTPFYQGATPPCNVTHILWYSHLDLGKCQLSTVLWKKVLR